MPHLVIIGGSDAGISAAFRARELAPADEVTVVLEDRYPNFSICGLPYLIAGEVTDWRNLAHRDLRELTAAGFDLRMGCRVTSIQTGPCRVTLADPSGARGAGPRQPFHQKGPRPLCRVRTPVHEQ